MNDHKRMQDLFNEIRKSDDLGAIKEKIEEMEKIVEEDEDLKYYLDAANEVCEILVHIEEENNPDSKKEEDSDPKVDFKSVMAALSSSPSLTRSSSRPNFKSVMAALDNNPENENKKPKVVAILNSISKGRDTKIVNELLVNAVNSVKNSLGIEGDTSFVYVIETEKHYLVARKTSDFHNFVIPLYLKKDGEGMINSRTPIENIDKKLAKRITFGKLLKYLRGEESEAAKKNIKKTEENEIPEKNTKRSIKASFEEVMEFLTND